MPTTTIFGLPWPDGNESNDVEDDVRQLAVATERALDLLKPVGVIESFIGDTAPPGYIAFVGQTVARSTIPRLAAVLGGTGSNITLPDYRGFTLRGATAGATINTSVGTDQIALQAENNGPHGHSFTPVPHGHGMNDATHRHDGNGGQFVISPSGAQQHIIPAKGPANSVGLLGGHVEVTFTPLTGVSGAGVSTQSTAATGNIGSQGSGTPISIIPRSKQVLWITRAA